MTNEAINHVSEVEETVARIREDAQEKIKQINQNKVETLRAIQENLEEEIRTFSKAKKLEYQENLTNDIAQNKESIKEISEKYNKSYIEKKEELTDYVVKEVLKRYGS